MSVKLSESLTRREAVCCAAVGLAGFCMSSMMNPLTAFAEALEAQDDSDGNSEQSDEQSSSVESAGDSGITFRGIPWYCTRKEAEELLAKDGIDAGLSTDEDIYRMSALDYANITSGSDRVDGGGVRAYYKGASVAGYKNVELNACYMWQVVDGLTVPSEDEALFYLAWYSFKEYGDYDALYADLKNKIDGLYGIGTEASSEYHTWTYWSDGDHGNVIRLQVNHKKTYATLAYMASWADERLDEVQVAMANVAALEEQALREENASNTSGL